MIEILTLFSFVLILGLVLMVRDWAAIYRLRRRRKYMNWLMDQLTGQPLRRANLALGDPTEVVTGSGGRQMHVWKGPERATIPEAPELLIVTIIADADGKITKAAWESR